MTKTTKSDQGKTRTLGLLKRASSLTLPDIRRVPGGADAIERLTAKGMKPNELESLTKVVVMAQIFGYDRPQDVEGFSRKSLPLFSSELRRTAHQINMIRANPFYENILDSWFPSYHWETTCENLRAYADLWDGLIRTIRTKAQYDPRGYDIRLSTKFKLLKRVVVATGSPNYELVATLLNAAYDVTGLSLTEEASALRHLWKNRMKKARYQKWALKMR
jgi:hypothetical protein